MQIGSLKTGEFYFVQIFKRRKDNPLMKQDLVTIDNFFVQGAFDLKEKQDRIIEVCDLNNARAYIRLNRRSDKKVALQTLRLMAENIAAEQYDIKNCYLSCCGQFHSEDNHKTWLIDVDDKDYEGMDQELAKEAQLKMLSLAQELIKWTGRDSRMRVLPTKNGYHAVCRPFNLKAFRESYPHHPDVHKDNPVLLYCP